MPLVSCRGAIENVVTLHVDGPGFDSRCWKFSFLFFLGGGVGGPFVLFCFVFFFRKTYFHFLTNLKYTGTLIAGSLSASISKIQ